MDSLEDDFVLTFLNGALNGVDRWLRIEEAAWRSLPALLVRHNQYSLKQRREAEMSLLRNGDRDHVSEAQPQGGESATVWRESMIAGRGTPQPHASGD